MGPDWRHLKHFLMEVRGCSLEKSLELKISIRNVSGRGVSGIIMYTSLLPVLNLDRLPRLSYIVLLTLGHIPPGIMYPPAQMEDA